MPTPSASLLEPQYAAPYGAWRADPSPTNAAALLQALTPALESSTRHHVGSVSPVLLGRAKRLALRSLRGYDPAAGRLQAYLRGQLQGMKRYSRQQQQVLAMPERVALQRRELESVSSQLEHELGRPPDDAELGERVGLSPARLRHLRRWHPGAAESRFGETGDVGVRSDPAARERLVTELVYDDLPQMDRQILEMTLGLNGQPRRSNQEIAVLLRRTPSAVTQRKALIQQRLDEAAALLEES